MDQQLISKEILAKAIREAISHVNRNLYEWTTGMKKGKHMFISHTEVTALVRNWTVRGLRKILGNRDADMLFRGVYISLDGEGTYLSGVHLSVSGESCKAYNIVRDILNSMNYKLLQYNPKEYMSEGMSSKKIGFEPFIDISFARIDAIKF